MWSLSSPKWLVGLSAQRITLARPAWGWSGKIAACEHIDCRAETPSTDDASWQPAVAALAQWLATKGGAHTTLHVVLSGRFVRWQLLPWQAELSQPKELAAYAALRFHETFGKASDDWQVMHSPQPPGQTVPACAVDAALIAALRSTCDAASATLATVSPCFASAFDHWLTSFNKKSAWIGLIEADCVSLGLLRDGQWLALRSQRVNADWRDALPGMMAQMGIAVGLSEESVPLYLTGGGDAPKPVAGLAFTWLQPKAQGI